MRVGRAVSEKQTIVKLTLQPGASVARVAQAWAVNGNQVFAWRRLHRAGKLIEDEARSSALVPVVMSDRSPRYLTDFTALMATGKQGRVPSGYSNESQMGVCSKICSHDALIRAGSATPAVTEPLSNYNQMISWALMATFITSRHSKTLRSSQVPDLRTLDF